MERLSDNERNSEWGRELRTELYRLVRDGEYDMVDPDVPPFAGLSDKELSYVLQPIIYNQFMLEDDTLVFCSAAASEEQTFADAEMSRNYLIIDFPLERNETGEVTVVKSLRVMLDEVSGRINRVERSVRGVGPNFKPSGNNQRWHEMAQAGRMAEVAKEMREIAELDSLVEDPALSEEEYAKIRGVLAKIDPSQDDYRPGKMFNHPH